MANAKPVRQNAGTNGPQSCPSRGGVGWREMDLLCEFWYDFVLLMADENVLFPLFDMWLCRVTERMACGKC